MSIYKSNTRTELPGGFALNFSPPTSVGDQEENPLVLGHKLSFAKQQRKLYTIYAGLISFLVLPPITSVILGPFGWQRVFPALFELLAFLTKSDPLPANVQSVVTVYVLSLYFTALICIGIYLLCSWNSIKLQAQINAAEENILSSDISRINYLAGSLRYLSSRAAVVLSGNQKYFELAQEKRDEAERILRLSREFFAGNSSDGKGVEGEIINSHQGDGRANDKPPDLGKADSLIFSIQELINQAENQLRQQRKWQSLAILVMFAYILLPFIVILSFPTAKESGTLIPVFGIPLSVIMWAVAGSLAAILYKFYMTEGPVQFAKELRWLIARPIIGIIMGALAYLAVTMGLLFIMGEANNGAPGTATSTTQNVIANPPGRIEAYWIIAFLAGFSDRFYHRIIELLASRTVGDTQILDQDTIHTAEMRESTATKET